MLHAISQRIQGYLIITIIKGIFAIFSIIPRSTAHQSITFCLRFFVTFRAQYKEIAFKNVSQVFPKMSLDEKEHIYQRSFDSLAYLLIDFIRGTTLTPDWIRQHITFPNIHLLREERAGNFQKGMVLLSGHLGSFEMLAAVFSAHGVRGALIARESNLPLVQQWWLQKRTFPGISVVERTGAFRKLVKLVKSGENVGIAFDQNVTRNLAIFAPFFDRDAATSIAPAFVALENNAPVFVCAIRRLGDEQYVVDLEQCHLAHIYENSRLTREEKLRCITSEMNRRFEDLILLQPEAWFWMHRRWKTVRYEGEANIYR